VIPPFALERAQELLFFLRVGMESGRLPRTTQVVLDSPMAISATEVFKRHPDCYDADARELFREGRDPFAVPGLHFVRETGQSMALNRISGGAIIMAGSGMSKARNVRVRWTTRLATSEAWRRWAWTAAFRCTSNTPERRRDPGMPSRRHRGSDGPPARWPATS
jgi:metallo-beta-lactamase family protein